MPSPQAGIDQEDVIKLCKDTFAEEYAKRMVQYHMDLTQEIDEIERAKSIMKDETLSHKENVLKVLNPLQIMSRLSQRTIE